MYIWVQYSLDDLVGANTRVIGTNYKIFYWAAGCAMRAKGIHIVLWINKGILSGTKGIHT